MVRGWRLSPSQTCCRLVGLFPCTGWCSVLGPPASARLGLAPLHPASLLLVGSAALLAAMSAGLPCSKSCIM